MFRLGDKIPASPESVADTRNSESDRKAKVVYIHPEGRFYILEFEFPGGTFRESRLFTEAEMEAGQAMGLFPKRRRPKSDPATGCPRGFVMEDDGGNFVDSFKTASGQEDDGEVDAAMF